MTIIKKLDSFILKKFLLVFFGAFFICLFVFMMQFTWRYVDELIGKGLSFEILAQFFWYMGQTLVPQALPLAILLSSLITFGNMGESLELLAMKAAGVPLLRIMRPIMLFAVLMTGVAFYFQNNFSPKAQINLRTLLISMKQQSPAVEIPEGTFYSGVTNVNLYVEEKDAETGMLYGVIIYKTDQGFEKAQIVLADSGRMEMTRDKLHLKLSLWSGEQFQNLQSGGAAPTRGANSPYDRETFQHKELLIDFDSNFNMLDKDLLSGMPSAKNMAQIEHSVDSISHELDSLGKEHYKMACMQYYKRPELDAKKLETISNTSRQVPFDSLAAQLPDAKRQQVMRMAQNNVVSFRADLEWKSQVLANGEKDIRRHWIEWHQKMALSLACLIFFFVGAPLGAIIRKGGLGLPTVISVAIFIIYYIINTSGMKMARDGEWNMVYGMWISTVALVPFGVFFTYKANKDSVVFNSELYKSFFVKLLGLRSSRHLFRKEVIIDDPHYDLLPERLEKLKAECQAYMQENKLLLAPNYIDIFFRSRPDERVAAISAEMEEIVEDLSNSKSYKELQQLNRLPIIFEHAHTSPFRNGKLNVAAGILLPIGLLFYLRIWRFRLRLQRDLQTVVKVCDRLQGLIAGNAAAEEADDSAADDSKGRNRLRLRLGRKARRIVLIAFALIAVAAAIYILVRERSASASYYYPELSAPEDTAAKPEQLAPPESLDGREAAIPRRGKPIIKPVDPPMR